jgi:hypothetical protein
MSQYDPNILPVPDFVLEGLQPDPSSPRTDFDNFINENRGDGKESNPAADEAQANFMRALGEYFERYNVAKDVRETTNAFVLGLQGMERNLFELGLRQVMDQIETGAENIDNPLLGGFIGGLGYLEDYAPSVYDYFNDMFGENETLDRSEILTNFGIAEDPFTPEEGDTFTFDQLVDRYNDAPAAQEYGLSVTYDPETNTFVEDVSGFGFEGDAATNTYTPEEFMERLGVEGSFEEKYSLPENEGVDLASLTPEQQADIWPDIKKALEGVGNTVGKIIFGPKGTPTSVDEWLDWVEEKLDAATPPAAGTMSNLPFPIVLTTTPDRGTWLDLKIPVNIEVNGNPIRIPLFDEDGNFVGSQEIKDAVVTSAGEILGPLGQIGSILTDGDGKLIADIKQIGNVLLNDLSLSEDGTITGSSSAAILVGELFFNEDGEWEEVEEVDPSESTVDDAGGDGLGDTTADNGEGGAVEDPGNLGLVEDPDGDKKDEKETDDTTPSDSVNGRGGPYSGGGVNNDSEDDQGGGGVDYSDRGSEQFEIDLDNLPSTDDGNGDDNGNDNGDDKGVVTDDGRFGRGGIEVGDVFPGGGTDDGGNGGNGGGDGLVTQPDGGLNGDDDGLINDGGENDDDLPVVGVDEEPLVGPAGPTGATGATGAAGAPGSRGGYMGGLSYELPQFVGVQYQPKDYTVELDRIINESLFKGMI